MKIEQYKENVDRIELDGQTIYLVGTAHVSQSSIELAENTIREINPDSVAIELCASRLNSLKNPDRWKNMDILSVIKDGKSYVLMAQLMLSGFQKKLGDKLKVKPGAEMMKALEVAEEMDREIILADREIRITLKRTWNGLGIWGTTKLVTGMIFGLFGNHEIDEEEIERMKQVDALEELMSEFSKSFPGVRSSLIDERDQYLAAKIRSGSGSTTVAVVGAGHVPGIKNWIDKDIDLANLEIIPERQPVSRLISWGIPSAVIALIVYTTIAAGLTQGIKMAEAWFWVNATFGALGSLLAGAHVLTIITAFLVSPFTSLNPLIAGGWVAGLVEALIRKPRVSDLETIAEDVGTLKGFWTNRVSKILLVIALTNLFGSIGTFIGIGKLSTML